ncbi:amino acid permease [Hyphomicrobium sp. D-2]|uniref:APC family permease n=1 Tax=Hyphomicrobium sp. D-2 TaxID=3041621 RepID=UPI0024572A95|nr:amino acid permease [Hyphomicrobium sp. D-2]MDH4981341.1 amino acid permease [Hyphomicrobium sp. D-2]
MAGKTATERASPSEPKLRRSLGLTLSVLYGLGVTIGAGIYVLIAPAVARAGAHAPLSFLLAALVMVPSAAAFAELSSRMPRSAGEATYVRAGLRSDMLARLVGLLVVGIAVISAATVSRGSAGYISVFLDIPSAAIVTTVVVLLGALTAWGIRESVTFAGAMTIVEAGGLVLIIAIGAAYHTPELFERLPEAWHGLADAKVMSGIFGAVLLAFFAFTGFEGLANLAEEVKDPAKTLPRAIFLTLVIVTVLYMMVVWVALIAVPHTELASSDAPLSLVYERVTGAPPGVITAIAIAATINGIVVFMVMGSRVIYGMASQGLLPDWLGAVNGRTHTPVLATAIVVVLVLALALAFPIEKLAEASSRVTLVVFAFVNAALVKLKLDRVPAPEGCVTIPIWVPAAGFAVSLGLLAIEFYASGGG